MSIINKLIILRKKKKFSEYYEIDRFVASIISKVLYWTCEAPIYVSLWQVYTYTKQYYFVSFSENLHLS